MHNGVIFVGNYRKDCPDRLMVVAEVADQPILITAHRETLLRAVSLAPRVGPVPFSFPLRRRA